MELFAKLGIDGRLLAAQLLNFGILAFLLHRFLYRPVLAMLEKRTAMIEQGVKDSQEARTRLESVSKEQEEILARARNQAQNTIERAQGVIEAYKKEVLEQTTAQGEKILAQARVQIAQEQQEMMEEARKEVIDLVLLTSRKALERMHVSDWEEESLKNVVRTLEKESV